MPNQDENHAGEEDDEDDDEGDMMADDALSDWNIRESWPPCLERLRLLMSLLLFTVLWLIIVLDADHVTSSQLVSL